MTAPQQSPANPLLPLGAGLGCLAVVLGAFGAHALKSRLSVEQLGWWQTGVQYQMWHALAVVGLGLSGRTRLKLPALLMAAGTAIFSGSLYLMAVGGSRWLGAVTPLGGLLMIAGWALLAWRSARGPSAGE